MNSRYGDLISVLPIDWPVRQLSDVAERIVSGGTPSRDVRAYWDGQIPWVTPGELTNLKDKYLGETRESISSRGLAASGATLLPRDSLMVTTRATLGSVALAARPISTNQGFKSVVFGQSSDPSFYFHFSQMLMPELIRRSSGTTFPEVSAKQFGQIAVPVPSLPEQRTIAQVLDTADEAIQSTERLIAKLERARQGLLHDLFTRGIDRSGQLRHIHRGAQFTNSPIGVIPKDWAVKTLADIGRVRSGATPSRSMSTRYFSRDGLPWVKTLDLNEEFIYDTDERISARAMRECSCPLLPPGSVLLAMYGGWAQIGRTGLLAIPASINQAISSVELLDSAILPEYLLIALQYGRERWKAIGASTRKDPNITRQDVLAFEVPVPSVLEQERVVGVDTQIKARIASERANLCKLRLLRQGLMADLLTGRVRVGASG